MLVAIARYEIVPGSLKRIEVNGQPRLVADVQVEMASTAEAKNNALKKLRLLTLDKKETIKIDRMAEISDPNTSQPQTKYLLHGLPFGLGMPQSNARVEIETPQGKQTLEIKEFALVPEAAKLASQR